VAWAHAICFLLFAVGVALRVAHFDVPVYTPDEDAYINFYGVPLFDEGLGALPALVRDYNSRPPLQQFPPPTRIGHLLPMVALMRLCGDHEPPTAALLSAFASVALLLIIWGLGAMIDPWVAAAALLFVIVSPLDLAMARRAWGDELLALCSAAMMLAAARLIARPQRRRWAIVALALGAYAVLIKETGLFLLGFTGVALTIVTWRAEGARRGLLMAAGGVSAMLVAAVVLAAACGGFSPVRTALAAMQTAARTNEYVSHYQTGGIGYYVRGLALVQPLSILLGVGGEICVAIRLAFLRTVSSRKGASATLAVMAWLAISLGIVAVLYPQKNLRFLSPIYPVLDLLAGAMIVASFRALTRNASHRVRVVAFAALSALLVGAAAMDHARFVNYFVTRGIPDLATPWFTR
jgi:4-amino-4-deoxy-L-arabinose transferase-like glycosyltransferase